MFRLNFNVHFRWTSNSVHLSYLYSTSPQILLRIRNALQFTLVFSATNLFAPPTISTVVDDYICVTYLSTFDLSVMNLKLRFLVPDVQTIDMWNNASRYTQIHIYPAFSALITNLS